MTRTLFVSLLAGLSCALIVTPTTRAASQPPEAAARLAIGTPIDREISGRHPHIYELALNAGEYADLVVEQRGIDVAVNLGDSAGTLIAQFDAESRKQGREVVGVVAQSRSVFRVNVRARFPRDAAGRYEIRIGEIRPATDRDRDLFEAHRLSTEAASL